MLAQNSSNLALGQNRAKKRLEPLLREKLDSLERLNVLKVAERTASLNSN